MSSSSDIVIVSFHLLFHLGEREINFTYPNVSVVGDRGVVELDAFQNKKNNYGESDAYFFKLHFLKIRVFLSTITKKIQHMTKH